MTDHPAVQVNSEEFARTLNNALAHVPANSKIPVVYITVAEDIITAIGTDGYTAGRDWCDCEGMDESWTFEPFQRFTFAITKKDAEALEYASRMDKKGNGLLFVTPDSVIFEPNSEKEAVEVPRDVSGEFDETFEVIERALGRSQEFRTAFQPQFLQRFAKVKADKTERVADIAIQDPSKPVLVKIGPSFRGLIMPVDRNDHAEKVGEDGLWD